MKKLSLLLLFIGLSIARTSFAHTIKLKNKTRRKILSVRLYGKNNKILKTVYDIGRDKTRSVKLSSNVQKVVLHYNKLRKKKRVVFAIKRYTKTERDPGFGRSYENPVKMRLTGGKITFRIGGKAYYKKVDKKYRLND